MMMIPATQRILLLALLQRMHNTAQGLLTAYADYNKEAELSLPLGIEDVCTFLGIKIVKLFSIARDDFICEVKNARSDGATITINTHNCSTAPSQNYAIAHAIGHLMKHLRPGMDQSYRDCGRSLLTPGRRESSDEVSANRYAQELLMPQTLFRPYLDKAIEVCGYKEYVKELMPTAIDALALYISKELGIPKEAVHQRILLLGKTN